MKLQRSGQREKSKRRETGSMPPPVPFVTRCDILEQGERPVPKQPPVASARPQRTLEAIARRLSQVRATGQRAEAERLEDEFYRKSVTHYTSTDVMPGSAQKMV